MSTAEQVRRPTVAIVVCAYTERRWDVLMDCLSAATVQAGPSDEVLLVVDHNDHLREAAAAAAPAGVRVVANTGAVGLSGGRNTGLSSTDKDVVVFLDDDAVPQTGWLDAQVLPYADPEVVGVGGVAAPKWLSPRPAWFPEEFLWVVGCTFRGIPPRPHDIRNPIGANMSFRREVLAHVGGFSEQLGRVGTLPVGCEETELSIKVTAAFPGRRIVHSPVSRVHHQVTRDRVRWSYFASRCWSEGLSKAAVTRLHGSGSALASERRYVSRVLPSGFALGVRDALHGDVWGLARSVVLVLGLLLTVLGYARGRASST